MNPFTRDCFSLASGFSFDSTIEYSVMLNTERALVLSGSSFFSLYKLSFIFNYLKRKCIFVGVYGCMISWDKNKGTAMVRSWRSQLASLDYACFMVSSIVLFELNTSEFLPCLRSK